MARPSLLTKIASGVVYVPLADACVLYGVSDAMLRRLCRSGHLDAVKLGRSWLVNVASARKEGSRGPKYGVKSKPV